ncbi:hypothetical protein LPJ73_007173 [Coemansia sp. RSA 2703]|nr:hypothetical protein LPJ73_007173 [Coemansia sp. RSA 2703]KAJ2371918.1 hypothetical protein IW150_004374 [Coemansia sp. RSA 2607]
MFMVIYSWFNRNYRPIRAKNLAWVTAIHIAGILWFLGNIVTNGHVRIRGAFAHCKLWIIWFRILFCYMYAAMLIVRFYALDRVFNQNKPFRGRTNLYAIAFVIVFNVGFCLISHLVKSDLTIYQSDMLELCDVTINYRIAALTIQWVMWAGVAVLIYRLRNIQSSFNEFRESLGMFIIAIIVLIDTTVNNFVLPRYPLVLNHRLEKTAVDVLGSNIIIWLILAQPVYNCMFNRRQYESGWLAKLTKDGHKKEYEVSSGQAGLTTAYAKMNDSEFQDTRLNFSSSDGIDPVYYAKEQNYYDDNTFSGDATLRNPEVYVNQDSIPIALRTNLHIHRPVLNTPSMFRAVIKDNAADGRHVV